MASADLSILDPVVDSVQLESLVSAQGSGEREGSTSVQQPSFR